MSEYTWRELERADMDMAAAHAAEMEYRAEQIADEAQKRLARLEHIVDCLGEVREEIVRCRDCKHAYPIFDEDGNEERDWLDCHGKLVELWDYYNDDFKDNPVEPDGFCAWGERREQ